MQCANEVVNEINQLAGFARFGEAFLKERGHVDSYPQVEVFWQRGHDPELEIWSCHGRKPTDMAKEGLVPAEKMALSPYETGDLHYLLHLGMKKKNQKSRQLDLNQG